MFAGRMHCYYLVTNDDEVNVARLLRYVALHARARTHAAAGATSSSRASSSFGTYQPFAICTFFFTFTSFCFLRDAVLR